MQRCGPITLQAFRPEKRLALVQLAEFGRPAPPTHSHAPHPTPALGWGVGRIARRNAATVRACREQLVWFTVLDRPVGAGPRSP